MGLPIHTYTSKPYTNIVLSHRYLYISRGKVEMDCWPTWGYGEIGRIQDKPIQIIDLTGGGLTTKRARLQAQFYMFFFFF